MSFAILGNEFRRSGNEFRHSGNEFRHFLGNEFCPKRTKKSLIDFIVCIWGIDCIDGFHGDLMT